MKLGEADGQEKGVLCRQQRMSMKRFYSVKAFLDVCGRKTHNSCGFVLDAAS